MSEPQVGGDRDADEEPKVSRRRVVAGGAITLGGLATLVTSTDALFQDTENATGTVQIDAPWELNYIIQDNTDDVSGNKASYTIQYQVEWLADFQHLELTVQNTTDGTTPLDTASSNEEDSFSFSENNGAGDTYEFTFKIYDSNGFLDGHVVTDEAGGDGVSQGDMSSVDSPTIDSFTITDRTGDVGNGKKAAFTVDYTISNYSNADKVTVFFDNLDNDAADATKEGSIDNAGSGSVSYETNENKTKGDLYEITVDVYNNSGVITDSESRQDTADGTDP